MRQFLKLFGVVDSNILSTFAVDIKGPCDLSKLVQYFFHSPKKYLREKLKYNDSEDGTDNLDDSDVGATLPGEIVPVFMTYIEPL